MGDLFVGTQMRRHSFKNVIHVSALGININSLVHKLR